MNPTETPRNRRTLVPSDHYTDPNIFAAEQALLFRNTWQFFCFGTDVREPNDFVSGPVADEPVVVRVGRGGECRGRTGADDLRKSRR